MTTPPYPLVTPPSSKSWLERNARWKIPLGCLLLVVLFGIFVVVVFTIVEVSFRESTVYQEALARARRNPEVVNRVGVPLRPGRVLGGQLNVSGSTGQANMSIPIEGPRGKATIILDARKVGGDWIFRTLEVQFEGQSNSVNLLEDGTIREQ